ncbi:hypothetical protein BDZ91DRAFT_808867 [Kalaharituber pfeilii]|nr:hypothetical protein BDZ91DRAFT_808867 [Kalaharituber pfeilii]
MDIHKPALGRWGGLLRATSYYLLPAGKHSAQASANTEFSEVLCTPRSHKDAWLALAQTRMRLTLYGASTGGSPPHDLTRDFGRILADLANFSRRGRMPLSDKREEGASSLLGDRQLGSCAGKLRASCSSVRYSAPRPAAALHARTGGSKKDHTELAWGLLASANAVVWAAGQC